MDDRVLIRWLVLFLVFDGDPFRWRKYLISAGSVEQWRDDGEFVRRICEAEAARSDA